jgi:hypothetical protein
MVESQRSGKAMGRQKTEVLHWPIAWRLDVTTLRKIMQVVCQSKRNRTIGSEPSRRCVLLLAPTYGADAIVVSELLIRVGRRGLVLS